MIDLSQIGRELRNLEPRTLILAGVALVLITLLLIFWRWYRQRRARNQPRDGHEVELLPRIAIVRSRVGERVAMRGIRRFELRDRIFHTLARSEQPDRFPHQITDLGRRQRRTANTDRRGARGITAIAPEGRCCRRLLHGSGSACAEHEALE